MDTEHDPIGEQLDTFAGAKLVYLARIMALRRRVEDPRASVRECLACQYEFRELTVRLAQLHRELGRFIQRHSPEQP